MLPTSSRRPWGTLRTLILLGTPLLTGIVSVVHPHLMGEQVLEQLQPQLNLWLGVHLMQLLLIGLLGVVIWLLVDGLEGRAAQIARWSSVPFLAPSASGVPIPKRDRPIQAPQTPLQAVPFWRP